MVMYNIIIIILMKLCKPYLYLLCSFSPWEASSGTVAPVCLFSCNGTTAMRQGRPLRSSAATSGQFMASPSRRTGITPSAGLQTWPVRFGTPSQVCLVSQCIFLACISAVSPKRNLACNLKYLQWYIEQTLFDRCCWRLFWGVGVLILLVVVMIGGGDDDFSCLFVFFSSQAFTNGVDIFINWKNWKPANLPIPPIAGQKLFPELSLHTGVNTLG